MGGLISPEYVEMNKAMHSKGDYGIKGVARVSDVIQLAVQSDSRTILDYGCGRGTLKRNMTLPVREYDPAIPGKDSLPSPADLVVCGDVLEHVEPECLEAVLKHLQSLTRKICFAVIHLTPAKKVLPDGRNAHLIQEDEHWWAERLSKYFDINQMQGSKAVKEVAFVLVPKHG